MRLNNSARAAKWARLKLIDMMILEFFEGNFVQWNAHKISINATQNSDMSHQKDASSLTLKLYAQTVSGNTELTHTINRMHTYR